MSYVKKVWDEVTQNTWGPTSEGYREGDQSANRCGRDFGKGFRRDPSIMRR